MPLPSVDPARLTALLEGFLEDAADPARGAYLLDRFSAAAPLLTPMGVRPRSEVDAAAFAADHALAAAAPDTLASGRSRLPALEGLALLSWQAEDDHGLAWFTAREPGGDRTLALAAGLRHEGDWKFEWLTLAERPTDWSYGLGKAQMLGEYTLKGLTLRPRTWLDLSYYRLFGHERPQLVSLPDTRYSCHSSGVCCRYDFRIHLPPETQSFLDAVPWDEVAPEMKGVQLPVLPDGKLSLKESGERCRFLDEHRHCMIHKALGRPIFGVCASFPFTFADTPEGVAVTTSMVCGSARQNLGLPLESRLDDLYFRLALFEPRKAKHGYQLLPGIDVPWEIFRDVEVQLIELLDRTDLPLYRRLWLMSRFLEGLFEGRTEIERAWETEPIAPLPDEERAQVEPLLTFLVSRPRAFFKGLEGRPLPEISHGTLRDEAQLTHVLKQLYFSKLYSYRYDLLTAHNLGIVLYLLALHLQAHFPDQEVPAELWQEIGAQGTHGSLGSSLFPDVEAGEAMRKTVGTKDYGFWLLRFPQRHGASAQTGERA